MDAAREMPRYQCHKQVWALKIQDVRQTPADQVVEGGSWDIIPADEGYAPIRVSHEWYLAKKPEAGGYYVVYPGDGYASCSPAKAFEDGYTRL
ncbi:MAG TPA: hypothetical protein VJ652_15030 [Noviherbaspirillum sp.]|nr:hypothetical protein [Noviherbaspirillum sp.]